MESTQKQDSKQMVVEDVRKQGNKSIVFRRQDDLELNWLLCLWNGAVDFIIYLDNAKAIKQLRSCRHIDPQREALPFQSGRTEMPSSSS